MLSWRFFSFDIPFERRFILLAPVDGFSGQPVRVTRRSLGQSDINGDGMIALQVLFNGDGIPHINYSSNPRVWFGFSICSFYLISRSRIRSGASATKRPRALFPPHCSRRRGENTPNHGRVAQRYLHSIVVCTPTRCRF